MKRHILCCSALISLLLGADTLAGDIGDIRAKILPGRVLLDLGGVIAEGSSSVLAPGDCSFSRLEIDTRVRDSDPNDNVGVFVAEAANGDCTYHCITKDCWFDLCPEIVWTVMNDTGGTTGSADSLQIEWTAKGTIDGVPSTAIFEVTLLDSTGTAFSNDRLPRTLELNDFDSSMVEIFFPEEGLGVEGSIDSLNSMLASPREAALLKALRKLELRRLTPIID